MAINYFWGWTEADLLAELRRCQEDLAAGKTQIEVGAGGVRGASQVSAAITTRIRMLMRALNLLKPTVYPVDQTTAITTAQVSFGPANPSLPADYTYS